MLDGLTDLACRLAFLGILNDVVILRILFELVGLDLDVVLVHDDVRVGIALRRWLDLVHILFQDHHLLRILIVTHRQVEEVAFVAGALWSLDGHVHFAFVRMHSAVDCAVDVLGHLTAMQDCWTSNLLTLLAVIQF